MRITVLCFSGLSPFPLHVELNCICSSFPCNYYYFICVNCQTNKNPFLFFFFSCAETHAESNTQNSKNVQKPPPRGKKKKKGETIGTSGTKTREEICNSGYLGGTMMIVTAPSSANSKQTTPFSCVASTHLLNENIVSMYFLF